MSTQWPAKKVHHTDCHVYTIQSSCDCGADNFNACHDAFMKAIDARTLNNPLCFGGKLVFVEKNPQSSFQSGNQEAQINVPQVNMKAVEAQKKLVPLDEKIIIESFEKFLKPHTCTWQIQDQYALNGDYFRAWIHELCAKFGAPKPRPVVTVEDIVRVMTDNYATCGDFECEYCPICANKTAQAIVKLLEDVK